MKRLSTRLLPLLLSLALAPAALAQTAPRVGGEAKDGGASAVELQTRSQTRARAEAEGGRAHAFGEPRGQQETSNTRRLNRLYSRFLNVGNRDYPGLSGATLTVQTGGTDPGGNTNDWVAWFLHEGTATNNESLIRHQHFSAGFVPQPIITGMAARGNKAAPGALRSGDYLFILDGRGHDGTANNYGQGETGDPQLGFTDSAAQVAFSADGDWSGRNHGTRISFKVIPPGSTTLFTVADVANYAFNVKGQFTLEGPGTHVNTAGANNSDVAGVITIAGATSGSKTFSTAYGHNPACVLTPVKDMGAVRWWVGTSPTAVFAHVSAAGSYQFYFHCFGNPN